MSLDTILKIGNIYRLSSKSKDYHELINRVSKDADAIKKKKDISGNSVDTVYYNIPVQEDKHGGLIFLVDEVTEITDEDKQKSLYYLNFKTSGKDAEKRYLFGDIVYSYYLTKQGEEEGGNYRLKKKASSFLRCNDLASSLEDTIIGKFRAAFAVNREVIEALLLSKPSVALHFNFGGKNWFDLDGVIDLINQKLMESFVSIHQPTEKLVLEKYLYKTLGGTTPGFDSKQIYKTKLFSHDEIQNLMYAVGASQKPLIRIKSIGVVALPKGDNLNFDALDQFLQRSGNDFKDEEGDEQELEISNKEDGYDDLFAALIENKFEDKVQYDILLMSIPASPAGVFADLVEISSIEKSLLRDVSYKINQVRQQLIEQAKIESGGKFNIQLDIKYSFLKILSDKTKAEKKYQFHLLKVLPQIYSDTYYQDSILLPAFIEKVENNIRSGGQSFSTLKYDFYFLMKIQKQNNFMSITESKSYTIGCCLGTMAKQFAAWRDDCPIKSFEKSYVGNLTRRISSLDEVTGFCDFLNQKLIIHNRVYPDVKEAYLHLVEVIKTMGNEKYNKHYCSLGFFENYYARDTKRNTPVESISSENVSLN